MYVVQFVMFPLHSFRPMVQDGQWDAGMRGGTVWPLYSMVHWDAGTRGGTVWPLYSMVHWDGMGSGMQARGMVQFGHSIPWYIGMGWTGLGVVQFGMFPLCPFLPMAGWTVRCRHECMWYSL